MTTDKRESFKREFKSILKHVGYEAAEEYLFDQLSRIENLQKEMNEREVYTTRLEAELAKSKEREKVLVEALEKAQNYIGLSPCDYDIYPDQEEAWHEYQEALKQWKEMGGL